MSALSAVSSTRVGRRRKFGEVSCTECTDQGNDFELISTVKIATRNPVEGYFGIEFPAVCNHCGVMTTWSRKTLEVLKKCLRFLKKTTLYSKIFKILFSNFLSRHRSICCVKISCNLTDGKSVKSWVAYVTKKNKNFACLSSSRYCADCAPNICQGQPLTMFSECSRFHPSRSVHFRWSYSRSREHRQNAP